MSTLWKNLAAAASINLSDAQIAQLREYLDLLVFANQAMNLTRITNPADAEVLHVGDALTLLPFLPRSEHRLADVGSGGGVPGLPLAIVRPDVRFVLIESTQKKSFFLFSAVRQLKLGNVTILPQRVEDVARSARRETFDLVTARAVAPMPILLEWCFPLLKTGGKLLAMKAIKIHEELPAAQKALNILNAGPPEVHQAQLPGRRHSIVVIPKMGRIPAKYPRSPAETKRNPL